MVNADDIPDRTSIDGIPVENYPMSYPLIVKTRRTDLINVFKDLQTECDRRKIGMDVVLWRALQSLAARGSEKREKRPRASKAPVHKA